VVYDNYKILVSKKVFVFTPILSAGFQNYDEAKLEQDFLNAFPGSLTREKLVKGLIDYIKCLKTFRIPFEIWIDGSFVTNKMNPNDIDLLIVAPQQKCDSLTSEQKTYFETLLNRAIAKTNFHCDVYFCVAENEPNKSYWRGWFGFSREELPKGIVRMKVS
jgi:hypothetical protein